MKREIRNQKTDSHSQHLKKSANRHTGRTPTEAEQHAFLDAAKRFEFTDDWKQRVIAMPALVNCQPCGRWSALHHAAFSGLGETVTFLLEHGAMVDIKTEDGRTPAQVAQPEVKGIIEAAATFHYASVSPVIHAGPSSIDANKLKQLFWAADKNGDGKLSVEEAARLFERLGLKLSEQTWTDMFRVIDADCDGSITYGELVDWLLFSTSASETWDEAALDQTAQKLGLRDNHLLYGVRVTAIDYFVKSLGFDRFDRKKYFERVGGKDWITPAYGEKPVGYDFGFAIRCWLEDGAFQDKSVAEVLRKQEQPGVGPASVFVSHVQSQSLEETLLPTRNDTWCAKGAFLWLDYVVLRQCTFDFEPAAIAAVIKHLGNTLAVLDCERSYLQRSFCIFEVAASEGCSFKLVPSDMHILSKARRSVDCRQAQTRYPEDKTRVDQFIEQGFGGYSRVDKFVTDTIQSALDWYTSSKKHTCRNVKPALIPR
eukprot:TRINITY_DN49335_c0_g1_i2.p1 TRINITY_DN49335_c0_g1~~TRINITY_DN49335_c0_g1_i2.p1  ORF type:complete len:483 (+),score=41.28 TRINITY_DN49335_c0_g1_i2:117-1565(+)